MLDQWVKRVSHPRKGNREKTKPEKAKQSESNRHPRLQKFIYIHVNKPNIDLF